ncbi:hypothetical protein LNKW23_06280 [Paralimibaculum aggregatum]|uniref:Uncharacterized protein n=1 Tax=Paralimibaculum aggregatum TaxID=3036245 RepID=A0ABQ6LM97_9RHOB|nr:hypothetical protein [Limibaculum sp. NKW23]GMG81415.1 hypothetical protein LNKW23_06280 [Limibaculum sp. NKW23]
MPVYIKFDGVEGESRAASTPKLQEACADGTFMAGDDGFAFAPVEAPMQTRESLEAAGLEVVVAAATTESLPAEDLQLNYIEIVFDHSVEGGATDAIIG